MSDVKIFAPALNGTAFVGMMEVEPNGPDAGYVQRTDYNALAAERDALKARLAEEQERLDFLQGFLFTRRWMPPIGSPFTWELVGHWRHQIKDLKGETFRGAIDAARAADSAPAVTTSAGTENTGTGCSQLGPKLTSGSSGCVSTACQIDVPADLSDAQDAARYRWLRDRAWPFEFKGDKPEDADAAIDAAMRKL